MMNAKEYKKYHESYMENNHGSSAPHVFFCILFPVQCAIYSSMRLNNCKHYQYFYEYIIIVLPLILSTTILAEHIYVLNFVMTIMLIYEYHQQWPKKISEVPTKLKVVKQQSLNKKTWTISTIRGLTYMTTIYCILAVDFKDFPRYLAKTERYGYSLMDAGVGLFVLLSGLVHKHVKEHSINEIVKCNLKICILVFLGLARCLSVKQLDYQEHVTEYGLHWNFFFTLAVCKLVSTVILCFPINAFVLSFVILFVHEGILFFGLQDWVFSNASRDTILSANREGISSCLGYVSLYLFAVHTKILLGQQSALWAFKWFSFNTSTVQVKFLLGSVALWILLYVMNIFRPISRPLANASYCIYLEATLVTFVAGLYFFENLFENYNYRLKVPMIIDSVNSNGLSYFLAANLMTGAINLSIRTLLVSSSTTFMVLNIYMISTLQFAIYLRKKGIKI